MTFVVQEKNLAPTIQDDAVKNNRCYYYLQSILMPALHDVATKPVHVPKLHSLFLHILDGINMLLSADKANFSL